MYSAPLLRTILILGLSACNENCVVKFSMSGIARLLRETSSSITWPITSVTRSRLFTPSSEILFLSIRSSFKCNLPAIPWAIATAPLLPILLCLRLICWISSQCFLRQQPTSSANASSIWFPWRHSWTKCLKDVYFSVSWKTLYTPKLQFHVLNIAPLFKSRLRILHSSISDSFMYVCCISSICKNKVVSVIQML